MTKKHKLTTTEKLQHNVNALAFLAGATMGMMILGNFIRQMDDNQFKNQQYWQSVEAPQPSG